MNDPSFKEFLGEHFHDAAQTSYGNQLAEVLDNMTDKTIVCAPPNHWRSQIFGGLLPAYLFCTQPEAKILVVSDFTTQNQRRNYIHSLASIELQRGEIKRARYTTVSVWREGREGIIRHIEPRWMLAGVGFDYIIIVAPDEISDPFKAREVVENGETRQHRFVRWYYDVIQTRKLPGAKEIIVTNRAGENDFIDQIANDDVILEYPALSEDGPLLPERYEIETLRRLQANVGPAVWEAVWQQNVVPLSMPEPTK